MRHIFQVGQDKTKPTFLLLHGTGGTEHDFKPFAEKIGPVSATLGVKGQVSENGMARFFARLSEGVFDEEDLILRTKELRDFTEEAANQYDFDQDNVVAMGYSNGANIAASLLFHYEAVLNGAILFHPMVPRRGIVLPDLTGVPVFIGAGLNDPLCPAQETRDLEVLLTAAGAEVEVHWTNQGHNITQSEVDAATQWYANKFNETGDERK